MQFNQHTEFVNIKPGGTYSYRKALKVNGGICNVSWFNMKMMNLQTLRHKRVYMTFVRGRSYITIYICGS
jgi:hypothetical protein